MTPERVDLPVTIRGLIEGIDADIKMAESGQIGRPEMLDGIFGKATALIKQGVLTDPKLTAIPALVKNVGLHPWVWRGAIERLEESVVRAEDNPNPQTIGEVRDNIKLTDVFGLGENPDINPRIVQYLETVKASYPEEVPAMAVPSIDQVLAENERETAPAAGKHTAEEIKDAHTEAQALIVTAITSDLNPLGHPFILTQKGIDLLLKGVSGSDYEKQLIKYKEAVVLVQLAKREGALYEEFMQMAGIEDDAREAILAKTGKRLAELEDKQQGATVLLTAYEGGNPLADVMIFEEMEAMLSETPLPTERKIFQDLNESERDRFYTVIDLTSKSLRELAKGSIDEDAFNSLVNHAEARIKQVMYFPFEAWEWTERLGAERAGSKNYLLNKAAAACFAIALGQYEFGGGTNEQVLGRLAENFLRENSLYYDGVGEASGRAFDEMLVWMGSNLRGIKHAREILSDLRDKGIDPETADRFAMLIFDANRTLTAGEKYVQRHPHLQPQPDGPVPPEEKKGDFAALPAERQKALEDEYGRTEVLVELPGYVFTEEGRKRGLDEATERVKRTIDDYAEAIGHLRNWERIRDDYQHEINSQGKWAKATERPRSWLMDRKTIGEVLANAKRHVVEAESQLERTGAQKSQALKKLVHTRILCSLGQEIVETRERIENSGKAYPRQVLDRLTPLDKQLLVKTLMDEMYHDWHMGNQSLNHLKNGEAVDPQQLESLRAQYGGEEGLQRILALDLEAIAEMAAYPQSPKLKDKSPRRLRRELLGVAREMLNDNFNRAYARLQEANLTYLAEDPIRSELEKEAGFVLFEPREPDDPRWDKLKTLPPPFFPLGLIVRSRPFLSGDNIDIPTFLGRRV